MASTEELKRIKKLYGEKFMHLCRELFPTILDQEGLLLKILETKFARNSRTLYDDLVKHDLVEKFKDLIFSQIDVEAGRDRMTVKKTPYELLEEAGYDLFECHSEEEIQAFRRYYAPGEELCTFRRR